MIGGQLLGRFRPNCPCRGVAPTSAIDPASKAGRFTIEPVLRVLANHQEVFLEIGSIKDVVVVGAEVSSEQAGRGTCQV